MSKVFIHGNPETSALWTVLLDKLGNRGVTDIVALSPPGFGGPLPAGFGATRIGYREWIIQQLEQLGGKIDLLGHDWGALHVFGVIDERPDLVRSWAADCAGILHPDYTWHDLALVWQTPHEGEKSVATMFGLPADQAAALMASFGIPEDVGAAMAPGMNDVMGECVLSLYRSAAQPAMVNLGERLRKADIPPGLVLIASEDPYAGTPQMCESVASDMGADTCTLDGLGHWWMFEGADVAADALIKHWNSV